MTLNRKNPISVVPSFADSNDQTLKRTSYSGNASGVACTPKVLVVLKTRIHFTRLKGNDHFLRVFLWKVGAFDLTVVHYMTLLTGHFLFFFFFMFSSYIQNKTYPTNISRYFVFLKRNRFPSLWGMCCDISKDPVSLCPHSAPHAIPLATASHHESTSRNWMLLL